MSHVLKIALFFCLCLQFVRVKAQDFKLESSDGEFIMEVVRETASVKVTLYFTDPSKYAYLEIEKTGDGQYRQCGYIDMRKSYGGAITAYDKYPTSALKDCYYRIRTVTTDKIERIYPGVRLPATTQQTETGNK